MVSPSQKRHAAQGVLAAGMCSGRRACRYLGLARSTLAYTPEPPTPRAVLICQEVVAISRRHPRFGYRRVHALLGRKGLSCARRVNAREPLTHFRPSRIDPPPG
jgi:putative transposase